MPLPVKSVTERNRRSQTLGRYTYPSSPGVHNIVLVFKKFNYSATENIVNPKVGGNVDGTVVLPIPTNLEDSYKVQVGQTELGNTGALALDVLGSAVDGNRANIVDDIQNFNVEDGKSFGISDFLSTGRAAASFARRNVLDSLPVGVGQAIDISSGNAVNPHVALKFDGVELKSHQFTWSLSPKNEAEAKEIRDLINYIQSRISPEYKSFGDTDSSLIGRGLLSYPDIVDIYFTGLNQKYFYFFKPAMISDFTRNYTPNGIALNRGGKPAMINLSMSLTEARIHTREDVNLE